MSTLTISVFVTLFNRNYKNSYFYRFYFLSEIDVIENSARIVNWYVIKSLKVKEENFILIIIILSGIHLE